MYVPPKVKPLCPPEERPRFEDVPYARVALDDGQVHTFKPDVYQSPEQNTPGPYIIYVSGGGFLWGEYKQITQEATYRRDLVRLTKEGYTVACPGYRLMSQSILPACIHNIKGVVRFLKASREKYNVDPDRIGALGNSAGGCLASMSALSANCRELGREVGGNLEYDSSIKATAIFYAPADPCQSIRTSAAVLSDPPRDLIGTETESMGSNNVGIIPALIVGYTGPGRSLSTLSQVLKRSDPGDPDWHFIELTRKCSPITYTDVDCPPMAIFQGDHDTIVDPDRSEIPYHALVRAGADIILVAYSSGGHDPSLGGEIDQSAYNLLKKGL